MGTPIESRLYGSRPNNRAYHLRLPEARYYQWLTEAVSSPDFGTMLATLQYPAIG